MLFSKKKIVFLQRKTRKGKMKYNFKVQKTVLLLISAVMLCITCKHEDEETERLYARILNIKAQGDSLPEAALMALDSLREEAMSCGSMHTERVYELTEIRLRDKAYLPLTSDDTIVMLCRYFAKHGTPAEKMESQYYLGRVSRETKNYPQAMEGFLRAIAIGESGAKVETQVLQCAYSQMSHLYTTELNREGAIEMAKKGLELSIKTGTVDPIYIMDVGTAIYLAGDTVDAMNYYNEALEMIRRDESGKRFPEVTGELLVRFSNANRKADAEYCLQCLNELPEKKRPRNYLYGLGAYCSHFVSADSAAQVYKRIFATSRSWAKKANSAWHLMWYYRNKGDYKLSNDYALALNEATITIDKEREFEQTAISSGEQLYRRSRDAEQRAREEAENNRIIMYLTIIVALAVILSISLYFNARQRAANRLLRQKDAAIREAHETLEGLNSRLTEKQTRLDLVMVTLKEREQELERLNDRVARTSEKMEKNGKALAEAKRELDKTGKQVNALTEELEQKQEELRRAQKKVRDLVGCTVAADADQMTSELVGRIQNSAARKEVATLSENDWNKLAAYIEALYPGFHLNARESIKDISPQKLRAACLRKIGLSQARIAQQMEFSPQTAMRWVKEFEEAFL